MLELNPLIMALKRYLLVLFSATLLLAAAACQGGVAETSPPPGSLGQAGIDEGGTPVEARTFEALWQAVEEHYVHYGLARDDWQEAYRLYRNEVVGTSEEEFAETINAALGMLPDGAAAWQSRADRIESERVDSQRYEGVGAFIAYRDVPEPHIVVLEVVPGSPAESAGLQAHDSILSIDGVPITDEEGITAVERIRGPSGSEVLLLVRSPDQAVREVAVTRASLVAFGNIKSAYFGDSAIGYMILPPAAYEGMLNDFLAHLQAFTQGGERPLSGLIIDLRVANSGAGWPLDQMLAIFADGSLGEFITAAEAQPVEVEGQDVLGSQTVPLIVLAGRHTQGLPEIFTGLVQSSGRGLVVGQSTLGAIEGVQEFPLPDGSVIMVSTVSFVTSTGRDIGLAGVTPDVPVAAEWDEVMEGRDPVINQAIEILTN
ncbi:MAG: S41 family peptidase [Anaerolineales bacterium]|nr:S41 family peptidase [Anaerolineales bacterium]